jgi:hypothetical protein
LYARRKLSVQVRALARWRICTFRETFVVVKSHSVLAPAAALLAALVLAPAASAATRYADDTGTGPLPCNVVDTPCSLADAMSQAQANDTVSIAAGTYANPAGLSNAVAGVEIVGESGGAKPLLQFPGVTGLTLSGANQKLRNVVVEAPSAVNAITTFAGATLSGIEVTASAGCVNLNGPASIVENSKLTATSSAGPFGCLGGIAVDGTTVRDVQVKSTSTTSPVFASALVTLFGANLTVDRLTVDHPTGPGVVLFTPPAASGSVMRRSRISGGSASIVPVSVLAATGDVLVTDTLVQATGSAAPAMPVTAVQATGGRLRNVTGVATGPGSQGLQVGGQGTPSGVTSVKNSVFRGAGNDVLVSPAGGGIVCPPFCNPAGDLTINRSNFRTASGTLNAASGDNQTADPQFASATGGDFHPAEGSPLIDAGVDDGDNGTTDLDGNARKQRGAIDIGAFELAPLPPPTDTTQTPQSTNPGGQTEPGTQPVIAPPAPDRLSPALSGLGLTNKTFAVGSAATPVSAAAAKKGTTFVFTLSEQATTELTIERAETGRRKGRSCVKATSKNRKAKKCTRYVKAGALTRDGTAGANAVPFSGRIGKKALKPATYRVSMVATDAAGNKSKPKTIAFKVVKK